MEKEIKRLLSIKYIIIKQGIKRLVEYMQVTSVLILLDDKYDRYPFHLPALKKILNRAFKRDFKIVDLIANVEPRKSSGEGSEPLIQIVDILIGAIGFVRNGNYYSPNASTAKKELVDFIEQQANTQLIYDTGINSAFNIWTFNVEKSMKEKKKWRMRKK